MNGCKEYESVNLASGTLSNVLMASKLPRQNALSDSTLSWRFRRLCTWSKLKLAAAAILRSRVNASSFFEKKIFSQAHFTLMGKGKFFTFCWNSAPRYLKYQRQFPKYDEYGIICNRKGSSQMVLSRVWLLAFGLARLWSCVSNRALSSGLMKIKKSKAGNGEWWW